MKINHYTSCDCGKKIELSPDIKYYGEEFSVACKCGKILKFRYWPR